MNATSRFIAIWGGAKVDGVWTRGLVINTTSGQHVAIVQHEREVDAAIAEYESRTA